MMTVTPWSCMCMITKCTEYYYNFLESIYKKTKHVKNKQTTFLVTFNDPHSVVFQLHKPPEAANPARRASRWRAVALTLARPPARMRRPGVINNASGRTWLVGSSSGSRDCPAIKASRRSTWDASLRCQSERPVELTFDSLVGSRCRQSSLLILIRSFFSIVQLDATLSGTLTAPGTLLACWTGKSH